MLTAFIMNVKIILCFYCMKQQGVRNWPVGIIPGKHFKIGEQKQAHGLEFQMLTRTSEACTSMLGSYSFLSLQIPVFV